jgi:peptidoglycan/xylan/chitin deacetylase (PgdA/CDA1 family)
MLEMERKLGFRSGVFFVAERYPIPDDLREYITSHDCEVGIHGLKHDGWLYHSDAEFQTRIVRIRQYLTKWNAVGFRSPAMHHRLDWLGTLGAEYDCSTFDIDPFEPQPDGMKTIFPFWVSGTGDHSGYVELPYTIPQDFTVFILLKQKGIDLWIRKLDWIAEHGGMALLITHPDYMDFEDGKSSDRPVYPIRYYTNFLEYIQKKYAGQYWHVLPRNVASFWKQTRERYSASQSSTMIDKRANTLSLNIV